MRVATAEQMRRLDHETIEVRGVPSTLLMENAAKGVLRAALELLGNAEGKRVAVLCGPGNNGGDGVAVTRLLLRKGAAARAFLVGSREKMTEDTSEMERRLKECGGSLEPFDLTNPEQTAFFAESELFIDAVIGIGLHSAVRGEAAKAIRLLEEYGAGKILAVDIASGIDADTGIDLGNVPPAAATVTFTLPKAGHFVGRGGVVCGRLHVADIGIPRDLVDGEEYPVAAVDASMARAFLPGRPADGHKGNFGKVYILGGSVGFTGAPVLAARAAERTGSGLVSLGVPAPIYNIAAVKCDGPMPSPLPAAADGTLAEEGATAALLGLAGKDAALIGPGLGRSPGVTAAVCTLLGTLDYPVVLDADGLNALSEHMDMLDGRSEVPTIITPHDGEFARLGGDLSSGDRLTAAVDFARAHGCVVVLKGHTTITAVPNGRAFLNTTGNSGMAKGGSGDVLGGMILSLLGQGVHPVKAAVAAVYLHGLAGDLCAAEKGEFGMIPSDLVEMIPYAIKKLTG